MSPPQLTADRPVTFFGQPILVSLGVTLREDRDTSVTDGVHGRLRQLLHSYEPLVGQIGFDRRLAAVGVSQFDFTVLNFTQQLQLIEVGDDLISGLFDRQALVFAGLRIQGAVGIQDVDHRQSTSQGHFVVVGDRARA